MLYALFWHRLAMIGACVLLLVMSLCLTMHPKTVLAKTAQDKGLSVERVWSRDGNGNDKTTFAPGDAIQYTTLIRNTYDHSVKMGIEFEAGGPTWSHDTGPNPAFRFIYNYRARSGDNPDYIDVPPGLSGFYSPWTLPSHAQPGTYYITIIIDWAPDSGGHAWTTGTGSFSVPGILAASVTTYLLDSEGNSTDTTTSASGNVANAVGPGGGLEYRITITNTSSDTTTGVVLTDRLPREIFDLIGAPTTDHGTCTKTGSWPSITVTCPLGSLASHETARVSFKASILVRNPDGTPYPPGGIINPASVKSDQQAADSTAVSAVRTAVTPLSDEDYNALVNVVEACVGVVPGIGSYVGFAVAMKKDEEDHSQLAIAVKKILGINTPKDAAMELLAMGLDQTGKDAGLAVKIAKKVITIADAFNCATAIWNGHFV